MRAAPEHQLEWTRASDQEVDLDRTAIPGTMNPDAPDETRPTAEPTATAEQLPERARSDHDIRRSTEDASACSAGSAGWRAAPSQLWETGSAGIPSGETGTTSSDVPERRRRRWAAAAAIVAARGCRSRCPKLVRAPIPRLGTQHGSPRRTRAERHLPESLGVRLQRRRGRARGGG